MKLYIANGQYVGTQAEAKSIDKGFEPVEVPTDKEGLIAYLNSNWQTMPQDHFETVVERQDPPIEDAPTLQTKIDIHELWPKLPISTQLHFAALAVEEARDLLPKMKVAPNVPDDHRFNKGETGSLEAEDLFS